MSASSELLNAICSALGVPLSRVLCEAGTEVARREHGGQLIVHPAAMAVA